MIRWLPVVLLAVALAGCGSDNPAAPSEGTLQIEDIVVGTGALANPGNTVSVHYVGTLQSTGAQFDDSHGREPLTFVIGNNTLIPGFDRAVRGMRVGGIRRATIPPSLAYGSRTVGPIPPNSTLVFRIELLSVG